MAGEAVDGAHSVVATIQPAITLLGLGIGAALASRALRLNPIVGYIGLGLGLASLGMAADFSGPLVAAMAEAGVMFLLFNLGLHFSLGRIRAEAGNIFGFGSLQMLVAGGAFAGLLALLGLPIAFAIIAGFGLGLSSTAVVIGLIRERDQEDCPVGRAAQAILIFQEIAAILLLVGAGALAEGGALLPALGFAGAKALAAFGVAVLFARFLTEPVFRLIARAGTTEVYTAQLRRLEAYVGSQPDSPDSHFLLGYHYMTCGHPDDAARSLREVVRLMPNDRVAADVLKMVAAPDPAQSGQAPAPVGDQAARPTPKPIDAATLVGTWNATRPDGSRFDLNLTQDAKFTWSFAQKDQAAQKFDGAYTVEGNILALERQGGGTLVAEITPSPDGKFNFKMLGAPDDDKGLTFQK